MATPWTKFRNLCAYYIDCVKYSEKRQEYLFTNQENNSYLLPALPYGWHLKDEEFEIQTSKVQLPARNLLITAEEDDELFIGYPMTSFIAPGTGTHCLCPIMLFPVDVSVLGPGRTSGLKLKIDRLGIDINRDWVEFHIPKNQQEYFIRSCEKMADTMASVDVDCALQFMSNWFKMKLDPNNMDFSMRHVDSKHEILNTAALFIGGKTKYTRNLIRELNRIKNEPDAVLDKTALAYVFRDPVMPIKRREGDSKVIPAVFTGDPLNYHQYLAVEEALNSPVTKVTGPPGTGKSHMSVNLIANEVFNGGSVLFTSKNHKAIHAVFEMCQAAKPHPDFELVEFCTVPGNDSAAQWDKMKDQLDTVKDLVNARMRNAGEESREIPDEIRFESLVRVEEGLDRFRDAEISLKRYEELRHRVSWFERLISKTNELLDRLPEPLKTDQEFIKLLEECASAIHSEPRLTFSGRLKFILRRWLGIEEKPHDMAKQLAVVAPDVVSTWASDKTVRKIAKRYLKLLRFKEIVEGWRLNEVDAIKLEMSKYSYDELKHDLVDALKNISASLKEAYIDQICRRLSNVETEQLISKLRGSLDCCKTASLSFLTSVADSNIYEMPLALFNDYHKAFPAWAVTLLSLRKASPCLPGVFSLVVIDEASQCEIPPMIPALFRAQRVAVVGDPDQFPPVITMKKARNDALRNQYGLLSPEMNKYSFCENNVFSVVPRDDGQTIKLIEHFRCMDEIAMYFNEEFYKGTLCPCVGDRSSQGYNTYNLKPGMSWIDAPGGDDAEIAAALEYLKALRRSDFAGSVGVISPLRKLADEMKTICHDQRGEMPKGLTDDRINTANGFQGGQCDVVLFLLGLNENRTPGRDLWYITADENKYIYNVSVSRAKVCFTTFGDRKRAIDSGISRIVKLVPGNRKPCSTKVGPGEVILEKALIKAGLKPVGQYPIFGRYLDLALVDEKIDIEVDGQAWHLDRNGCTKADDIHRDLILEINGWTVVRVWHHEVINDIDGCVKKIRDAIKNGRA